MAQVTLTPAEHARADSFEMFLRADSDEHDSEQLSLDYAPFAGIIGGRKECGSAAQTASRVTAPPERSTYA